MIDHDETEFEKSVSFDEFMDMMESKEPGLKARVEESVRLRKLVSEQFTAAREAAGLTQAEVAERAQVAEELIVGLERGSADPPYLTLASIARVLGVQVEIPPAA